MHLTRINNNCKVRGSAGNSWKNCVVVANRHYSYEGTNQKGRLAGVDNK